MKHPRMVLGVLPLLLLTEVAGGWIVFPEPVAQENTKKLIPESPASARPSADEMTYWFALKAGDYFELSVQKTGTDLSLSLLQPDGRTLRSVPCSHDGPLRISEIASETGRHILEVKSCDSSSWERAYEISLSQPRPSRTSDRSRVAGERLSADANSLITEYKAQATRAAIAKYEQALTYWRGLGDHIQEITTLNRIARIYRNLGDLSHATSYANSALKLSQDSQYLAGVAETDLSLAMVYLNQGDADMAVNACSRALELARELSNAALEAEVQYFLGTIYAESTNDYEKASSAFERAKGIWYSTGNRLGQARASLAVAGWIDFSLTRVDDGPKAAQQALAVFQSLKDRAGEASALITIALFDFQTGRKQDALNMFEKANPLIIGSGDLFMEVSLLNATARVYYDLGRIELALQLNEMALAKNEALRDHVGVAYSLLLMGESYFAAGNIPEASAYLSRALDAFRALSNKRMEGVVLGDLALVFEAQGDRSKALNFLNQSLTLVQSVTDHRLEALTLSNIGHIFDETGESDRALQYYEKAIQLNRATDDSFGEVSTLHRIARSLRATGKLEESLPRSEAAIKIIEGTRATVASSALRTSYFASVRQQYELYIDVLMRLYGKNESASSAVAAFEASERSRARTLLDTIAEARLSLSQGVDPQQLEREVLLKASIEAKAERYRQVLSSNGTAKAAAQLDSEIQRLNAELDELQGQIKLRSPRYASLVQPEPLKLVEIQNDLLDDDSLLLEYVLGDENSYLWAITHKDFSSYVLPKRSEIEAQVRRVREIMTARLTKPGETLGDAIGRVKREEAQYTQTAAELSRILLGPVADRLGSKRLVIVGEGILQYLPFGALPTPPSDGTSTPKSLIEQHEIVNLPSASTLAVIRKEAPYRGNPDRTLAVFADPVFQATDTRVTVAQLNPSSSVRARSSRPSQRGTPAATLNQLLRGSEALTTSVSLPRLLATQQEAKAISELVPEDKRFLALGFDATKTAVMNEDMNRYGIVHFATHTILDENHPDLSSMVMSLVDKRGNPQNGYLRLRDIYNLKLSARLVVLSACETGLGKDVKGEGLISMVRAFMYSGTPRVLASLWKIDDEATAELMTEFYKHVLQEGLTPAAALRQAQITQMQKKSRQSPYYWAGFQLQGEWN
jgi:CHAT domain-containing protein/Tfp pilus assembly protein PilF